MNRRDLETQLLAKILEVIPIIKKNNDLKNLYEAIFSSLRGKNLVVAMDYYEKEKLDAPAKYLLGLKEINEKYSEIYIENIFLDCYNEILSNEKGVNDCVKEVVNKLISNIDEEYLVISELENIELIDDQEYELIDSVIKTFKKEDIPFDLATLGLPATGILNKPVIITKVKAKEIEKAKEIALHRFMVSLNLIRLYIPSFKPSIKGSLHSGIQSLITYCKTDKSLSADMKRLGDSPIDKAKISSELYKRMLDSGIGELRIENSISRVVKDCLYWYGSGLDESYPAARLIDFVTILESALKKKGEMTELKRAVSERGAILLNDKFEDRKAAFDYLIQIYKLRSKVIHTGAYIDDKDLISKAGGYARAILLTLIEKSIEMNGNFDDFINYVDDIKLGKDINA